MQSTFLIIVNFPRIVGREGGTGGREPGRIGGGKGTGGGRGKGGKREFSKGGRRERNAKP